MTKPRSRASDPGPALAERLARMSIAEIDAMSDREVAELMGATEEEIATERPPTRRGRARRRPVGAGEGESHQPHTVCAGSDRRCPGSAPHRRQPRCFG